MQYDTDVVTWSPQGRIHQIEYAMEAVKQGSAAVGLKVNSSGRSHSIALKSSHGQCLSAMRGQINCPNRRQGQSPRATGAQTRVVTGRIALHETWAHVTPC